VEEQIRDIDGSGYSRHGLASKHFAAAGDLPRQFKNWRFGD
jgi:hypothetical protein